MSLDYKVKSHRKKMPQEQHPEVSEASDTEVIELTAKDKKPIEAPIKKQATQKQLESMKRAQAARQEQLRVKREEEEEAKRLIEKSYHAELEAQLIKTEIPKYSKQIKKQILEKLRKQKLEELKKQYGYKSDVSESDSDSDEEVVVVRKKAPKKQVQTKQEPMIVPKKGLLQTYKDFGF